MRLFRDAHCSDDILDIFSPKDKWLANWKPPLRTSTYVVRKWRGQIFSELLLEVKLLLKRKASREYLITFWRYRSGEHSEKLFELFFA